MTATTPQLATIVVIGFVGGVLGGLLGLGGSVFIIPALTLLLGTNQHLFQAAALVANVFVATAATLRHRGRQTIRMDLVPSMLGASMIAALAGVGASNLFAPKPLAALFGAFLCYASLAELRSLLRKVPDPPSPPRGGQQVLLGSIVGVVGGFASGLLGIGGGAVMVPLLRKYGKLPVREAVATSACAMIGACVIGAVAKNASLGSLTDAAGAPLSARDSLLLAMILTPTATAGGLVGASLVYRLPIGAIRAALATLLAVAGVRMILTGGAEVLELVRASITG